MTYTAAEGRQEILDALATAAEELGLALAELSEAYEHLDEHAAERLEETLFRPVQAAYGRAKAEHAAFAERSRLPGRAFETPSQAAPSTSGSGLIQKALDLAAKAEGALADLQDTMLPVEVGDAALRASLMEIRQSLGGLRSAGREILRTLGR